MKKLFLFIILFLPLQASTFAQEKKTIRYDFTLGDRAPVFISYYGNLAIHPGVKAGFNWNLFLLEKTKEKKKVIKTKRKLLYVAPSLAWYIHPRSNQGLIIKTDLDWRMYAKRLSFTELGIGAGYFRKFNAGETWEVDDQGTVTNEGGTSRGYFDASLSFAYGRQFSGKKGRPVTGYLKANSDFLVGYNAAFVPEFSLELGVMFTPGWSIKRGNVKTKAITKNKTKAKAIDMSTEL